MLRQIVSSTDQIYQLDFPKVNDLNKRGNMQLISFSVEYLLQNHFFAIK